MCDMYSFSRFRSLTRRTNFKFMCLSAYCQWQLANERAWISAVIVKRHMFSRAYLPFPRLLPTKGFLAPANHFFVFPRLLSMLYFFEFLLVDYADFLQLHLIDLSRIVRKPVNANPGLKVKWSIRFSCLNILFGVYVLFWALFNSLL